MRISWSIRSEKSFGHVPPVGVEPSTSCVNGVYPIRQIRRFAVQLRYNIISKKKKNQTNVYRVLSNYNLISGFSDEGCWRSENGHNPMHFEKKKLKLKKNDLVIYSLNCKSMVKQPHLNICLKRSVRHRYANSLGLYSDISCTARAVNFRLCMQFS